jgi:hypothetical protein
VWFPSGEEKVPEEDGWDITQHFTYKMPMNWTLQNGEWCILCDMIFNSKHAYQPPMDERLGVCAEGSGDMVVGQLKSCTEKWLSHSGAGTEQRHGELGPKSSPPG